MDYIPVQGMQLARKIFSENQAFSVDLCSRLGYNTIRTLGFSKHYLEEYPMTLNR